MFLYMYKVSDMGDNQRQSMFQNLTQAVQISCQSEQLILKHSIDHPAHPSPTNGASCPYNTSPIQKLY